jgi:hypothetical protein
MSELYITDTIDTGFGNAPKRSVEQVFSPKFALLPSVSQ